jgi:diacylglycerol kinase family enzyme
MIEGRHGLIAFELIGVIGITSGKSGMSGYCQPMTIMLINGKAGSVAAAGGREKLDATLRAALPDADIIFTDANTDVEALAREAVARGTRLVVAGGGDGTLSSVAAALVGSETVLGVLPLGTLNHFAKDLAIPLDIEGAVDTLVNGETAVVDVGEVNGSLFLNNSGLGLYPVIVHLREHKQRLGVSKWPAALWATLKALARYERLSIRVVTEGQERHRRTPVVFVGNNEYSLDGVQVPTRSRLDDGLLCVYIPHAEGRLQLIWFSIRALFRRPRSTEAFDAILTTECRIDTRHRLLKVSLDGEVRILPSPLHYRIRPQSLKVMIPKAAT